MLKFSASVLSGETPVNEGDSLVTLMFQRRDLSLQYHLVADSTVETLIATLNSISAYSANCRVLECNGTPGAWRGRHRTTSPACAVERTNRIVSVLATAMSEVAVTSLPPASFREHEQVSSPFRLVLVVISFGLATMAGPATSCLDVSSKLTTGCVRVVVCAGPATASIRATNSPLTSGMHHSFFFHGLSSFF